MANLMTKNGIVSTKAITGIINKPSKQPTLSRHTYIENIGQVIFALLFLCCGVIFLKAQEVSQEPDKFSEALVYAEYADASFHCRDLDSLSMADPIDEATNWTDLAIKTIRQFRSADPHRKARAEDFVRRQKSQLETFQRLKNLLKELPRKVEGALKSGKLDEAATMVEAVIKYDGAPVCHPTIKHLQRVIAEKRKALLQEGHKFTNTATQQKIQQTPEAFA